MPQDKALRKFMFDRKHPAGLVKMVSDTEKSAIRRAPAAKKDVQISFDSPMSYRYFSSYGQWNITAQNADYSWYSDFEGAAESILGTYQTEDFDLPAYCYLKDLSSGAKIIPAEIQMVVAESEVEDDRIDVSVEMTDSAGVLYIISMFYATPQADSQVEFTATNLEIGEEDVWGMFTYSYLVAGDENLGIQLEYWGEGQFIGTLDIDGEDLSGSMYVGGEEIAIYSGQITIELTADGYHVTGAVLAFNNVEYVLDLTYVLPNATRNETLTANVSFYNLLSEGLYQLYGYTADGSNYISVVFYSQQVAGTYTKADMYLDYSYIVEFVGNDTIFLDPLAADLTVTMDNLGAISCTGTMLVQNYYDPSDIVNYTINLSAGFEDETPVGIQYDEQNADFNEAFATYEIDNQYLAQYGDLLISAENNAGAFISLDMYIPAGTSALAAGTYTIADTENPLTVYPGLFQDGYIYPSCAGYQSAQGVTNVWFLVSGTVVVNADGSIVVNAQNSYGKSIQATLNASTAVETVGVDAVAAKRIVNGALLIERNGEVYNAQGIRQ